MSRQSFRTIASFETITLRSELLRSLREFFHSQQFIEVQPPVIGSEFVIDRHIDPIEVTMPHPEEAVSRTWYLQSSPEASMKRLMASLPLERIYSIGPVFRFGESGVLHNPEFTMVEWYRTGDDLDKACEFVSKLVDGLLHCGPASCIRFVEVFEQVTGKLLFDCTLDDFAELAIQYQLGVERSFSNDWDDWVNLIFSEVLQPKLGLTMPQIVTHFPASQAALARIATDDPRTAERFEFFLSGVELANGYCELLEANEFEARCRQENALRVQDGKQPLPIPQKLIDAMRAGLPAMSGCALGFDRLIALAANEPSIKSVVCFPTENA